MGVMACSQGSEAFVTAAVARPEKVLIKPFIGVAYGSQSLGQKFFAPSVPRAVGSARTDGPATILSGRIGCGDLI